MLKTVDDFRQKEEIMKNVTYSTFGGFCDYFERSFKIYMEGIEYFNKRDWQTYRWEKQFCLATLAKLANTFKSSYELCADGYFTESIMLTRQIYEAFLRMLFIKKSPDKAKELFGRFNVKEAEKRLGIKNSGLYFIMSEFTHGHKFDIAWDLVGIQQGKLQGISVGPQNPKNTLERFAPAMNTLMFYIWCCLELMTNVLPELNQNVTWKKNYNTHMQDLENNYVRKFVTRGGKPNTIALKGVDEVLNVIRKLPQW